MNTIYVYKEFYDSYAYGEELIEVYESLDNAKRRLKECAEEYFECKFINIPKENKFDESDTFSDTYISYNDGNGCHFWIIEEKQVM